MAQDKFRTLPVAEDLDNLNLHSASEEEEDPEVPLFDRGIPSDSEEDDEEDKEEPVKPKARFFHRRRLSQSPNASQTKATSAQDNVEEDSVTGI
jgi:hypothetical protein